MDIQRAVPSQGTRSDFSKAQRLVSLDLLRGLAVIGMIIVNEMAGMESEGAVYPALLHSSWAGLTIADVVFPAFLFMVGVSIPLSRKCSEDYAHILWRTVRLLLLGFILSNVDWFASFHSASWRLFGVLQRIGLVYGACALLFLNLPARTRLIIAAAILLAYWPLTLIPALDGLPNDIWMRGHNFVGSVDRVLLGEGGHIYVPGREGYDPEGLLGTLPAIAQGLLGVATGEFALRNGVRKRIRAFAIAGTAMLLTGIAWSVVFPIVKDLWSSSFVLVTSGLSLLILAVFAYLFDGRDLREWRRIPELIILPFGMNAIAAYTLHILAGSLLGWDLLQLPYRRLKHLIDPQIAAFIPVLMFLGFIWLSMLYLWRKRWAIRI